MGLLYSWSFLFLLTFLLAFNIDSNINGVTALHKIYKEYQHVSVADDQVKNKTGFHFQTNKNWINDPNGPMYYKGLYHFFCQYNPEGAVWGNINWAHSVSKDLINWQALEPAIYPSKFFDQYGCWSGSVTFLPGNKPVIIYTGLMTNDTIVDPPGIQVQNYAIPANYSDPYLREWIKPDDNPIIIPTHGETNYMFRDPTTAWFERGHWNILVGGMRKHRGISHLYRSKDFKKWTHAKHALHSKEGTGMWECPDFFPVSLSNTSGLDTSVVGDDVKHVLKNSLSLTRFDYYTIGTYDTMKDVYVPDNTSIDGWLGLRYDYGNFYASKSFYDPAKNRRVLWGWANESDTTEEDVAKGWAGVQLIPRKVWLDPSKKQLLQWPVEELDSLRDKKVELSNITLNSGDMNEVSGITAAQADVDVTFSFSSLDQAEPFDPSWNGKYAEDVCNVRGIEVKGGVGPFGILALASKNLEEYTPIFFRVFKDNDKYKVLLCSDAKNSSLNNLLYKPSFGGFVDVDLADMKLSFRSLIDHSVIETFGAGGKTCMTSRVYPNLAVLAEAHLHVFNKGSETITVDRLEAWSMKSAEMNNNG